MFVTRKSPPLSVVRLWTSAVPWLVIVTFAAGTLAPAGSTTVPSIELLWVWPKMDAQANVNTDMACTTLRSFIAVPPAQNPAQDNGNRFHTRLTLKRI